MQLVSFKEEQRALKVESEVKRICCECKQEHKNMALPYVSEDLLMEILSWLPVKYLMQFKCVSKSFRTLISDPVFVKLHLKRSPKNENFLISYKDHTMNHPCILSCPLHSLLENPSSSPLEDHLSLRFHLNTNFKLVGTCNGLVCLVSRHNHFRSFIYCLWNPATRQAFGYTQCVLNLPTNHNMIPTFGFGYETVSDNYKLVSLLSTLSDDQNGSVKSCNVKILTLGDNDWRSIEDFPADPIATIQGCGIYLNNSLHWLASALTLNHYLHYDEQYVTFDQLVIVSLDLRSERFTRLLLPPALDGVYTDVFNSIGYHCNDVPRIGILNDCLSLFVRKIIHFSIWRIKELGNRNSWTRLINITLQDIGHMPQPLCMLQNDSVLVIAYCGQIRTIFREGNNVIKCNEYSNNILWIHNKDYVQSLLLPRIY